MNPELEKNCPSYSSDNTMNICKNQENKKYPVVSNIGNKELHLCLSDGLIFNSKAGWLCEILLPLSAYIITETWDKHSDQIYYK